jgi:hypothetical protein
VCSKCPPVAFTRHLTETFLSLAFLTDMTGAAYGFDHAAVKLLYPDVPNMSETMRE